MFVPVIPNTKIINKTIVYSDTVLTINRTGRNIEITSINNVEEYDLENCLKCSENTNHKKKKERTDFTWLKWKSVRKGGREIILNGVLNTLPNKS